MGSMGFELAKGKESESWILTNPHYSKLPLHIDKITLFDLFK